MLAICQHCKQEFFNRHTNQKFCSRSCAMYMRALLAGHSPKVRQPGPPVYDDGADGRPSIGQKDKLLEALRREHGSERL